LAFNRQTPPLLSEIKARFTGPGCITINMAEVDSQSSILNRQYSTNIQYATENIKKVKAAAGQFMHATV
jgi:hypothetical protein